MTSASSLRFVALAAACFGPAFYLSGCGGGSSGPSAPPAPVATATPVPPGQPTPTPTNSGQPTPTPVNPTGGGSQLLFDDFSSGTLDPSVWDHYTKDQFPLQRTGWGGNGINLTEGGTSLTRLTLDSYNPDAPGKLFRGTEIYTRNSYLVGNGLEAEARLRGPNLPSGLVFAFFLINNRFVGTPSEATYRKDEIDFEFLTKQQEEFGNRNRVYSNVWNNWNERLYGFDSNPNEESTPNRNNDDLVYKPSVDPNYDYANWNVYKIRWYPDRTEFYINDRLERIEREVKPDQAMQLHLNFWTSDGTFQQAFSGSLPGQVDSPSNSSRNTYQFDVDYVRLTALGSGAGSARLARGAEAAKPLPPFVNLSRSR